MKAEAISHDSLKKLDELAERLHAIRKVGILDAGWIAGEIEREVSTALERAAASQKPRGALSWLGRFVPSFVMPAPNYNAHAKRYANAIKALLRDRKNLDDFTAFQKRLRKETSIIPQFTGLSKAVESNWLHILDLPIDALAPGSFDMLLTASFYRFAYGKKNQSVDYFSVDRTLDTVGVYLTFHRHNSKLFERRVLAYDLIRSSSGLENFIQVVELSRQHGRLIVRAGVAVPNLGHQAFILSGTDNVAKCRELLIKLAGAQGDALDEVDESAGATPQTNDQSHRLGFLTLRTRSPGEIIGSFLDGEMHGELIGRRLAAGTLTSQLIATIGLTSEDPAKALSVDQKTLVSSLPPYDGAHEGLLIAPAESGPAAHPAAGSARQPDASFSSRPGGAPAGGVLRA
ncbi:MAG: hypothetical protein ACXIVL_10790 [Oceanicaulis sp.]